MTHDKKGILNLAWAVTDKPTSPATDLDCAATEGNLCKLERDGQTSRRSVALGSDTTERRCELGPIARNSGWHARDIVASSAGEYGLST